MSSNGRSDLDNDQESTGDDSQQAQAVSQAEAALRARLGRKRTKTGCLTCRKRRIKCGEERPVCKNCVKSRRHCEGYTQRVLFRPQNFDYRATSNGGAHITFQSGPEAGVSMPFQHGLASPYAFDDSFSPLQPRHAMSPGLGMYPTATPPEHNFAPIALQAPIYHNGQMLEHGLDYSQAHVPAASTMTSGQVEHHPRTPEAPPQLPHISATIYDEHSAAPPSSNGMPFTTHGNSTHTSPLTTEHIHNANPLPVYGLNNAQQADVYHQFPRTAHASGGSWSSTAYTPRPELTRPIDQLLPRSLAVHGSSASPHSEDQSMSSSLLEDYQNLARLRPDHGATQLLNDAAVEVQDDDYYDIDPEESAEADMAFVANEIQSRLRLITTANQLQPGQGLQQRTYDTFLYSGMLDRYRVEQVANPLRNPATARVFMHFLTATGPSLSPFERNSFHSRTLFTNESVPISQRGLWNYTMPMAALQNQGLLHAILALASLHIARLQGGSATPSMQHYAWSLKRIHNAVANRKKRLHVATIAASMLLGFYEIMTADHSKWNTHLAGAKQLFLEVDFSGMMRRLKEMKVERQVRLHQQARSPSLASGSTSSEEAVLDSIPEVDEHVVSQIFGQEVRYGQQGFVENARASMPAQLDLHRFEILKDLFWWYCKQDAYQSLVSGNPLLMDYGRWAVCPPRAPMNRSDQVYGTFDHLTLLLGRVAAFSAKDKARKISEMEKNGGQWVPHPASHMAQSGRPQAGGKPMPGPEFFGMTPAPRSHVQMPASYQSLDDANSPVSEQGEWSIEAALEEYEQIQLALRLFKASLGQAFQPLGEGQPTPFGSALCYRSHDIGCLWSIYNMTVIVAIRSHPYHHPAAHVAAAMAVRETVYYANEIGRIAAGIVPSAPGETPLNPALGSALVESCMPSFFAGIQYHSLEQRHATVTRISKIARLTGWGTADLIANGCETAWVKAAQAGRGPPYERMLRPNMMSSTDSRLNGSYEMQDPSLEPDEDDQIDRRFIRQKAMARLHWAIGIMGTENDI